MKSVIALIGRPNVGKSTFFNRLTGSRDALVADQPGLTRDRQYGTGRFGDRGYIVIDTGGLDEASELSTRVTEQSLQAVEEADISLFFVDGREGLSSLDQDISKRLRQYGKQVLLVVNKAEGLDPQIVTSEFHALGLGEPFAISAEHGQGMKHLMSHVAELLPQEETPVDEDAQGIKIAIVGRPNVGKSTLVNRMLGEERVVAYDTPGTTRDSIYIPFERNGKPYTLIDTAGVRRRGRVDEAIEKFSVIKTLKAIEDAHVVIFLFDAREGVTAQDMSLLGYVVDEGRALVLGVNKWDGLDPDQREKVKRDIDRKLAFISFASVQYISALHGTGVGDLTDYVDKCYQSAMSDFATPRLTQILEDAVQAHQPPLVHGRRIKLRYAHQGGKNPPVIVIHGNQTQSVPNAYRRYLMNTFRKVLHLIGTPVRIEFKSGENPFKGKKNVLNRRQELKRLRNRKRTSKFKKRS